MAWAAQAAVQETAPQGKGILRISSPGHRRSPSGSAKTPEEPTAEAEPVTSDAEPVVEAEDSVEEAEPAAEMADEVVDSEPVAEVEGAEASETEPTEEEKERGA